MELKGCDVSVQCTLPVTRHPRPIFQQHGATLVYLALAKVRELEVAPLAALRPALRHLASPPTVGP